MPQNLLPKIILITGTSSGLGLLMAARLASRGNRVVATMRPSSDDAPLKAEVNLRGGRVHIERLDVTDTASIQTAVSSALKNFSTIDVLINNAGYGLGGFFEDMEPEEIRRQMETNFFGVQSVTRAVLPVMRKNRAGRIINISSVSGFSTSPAFGAYNASKWALEAFSESLRYELRFFGIDVCLVEPGTYPTKIFYENARYAARFDDPQSPYYTISQFLRRRLQEYVGKCRKNPEDVARLVQRLVEQKRVPFRSIPDTEGRCLYTLRRLLPFRLYSTLIEKGLFQNFKFLR